MRDSDRHTTLPCGHAAAIVLLAASLVTVAPAAAQLRQDLTSDGALRPDAMRDLTASGNRPLSAAPSQAPVTIPALSAPGWLGSSVQIEPSRLTSSGTYTRPRIVFGLQSESMKRWMDEQGVATERCYLPMVRARARINAEGEASGALWLYARCTLR